MAHLMFRFLLQAHKVYKGEEALGLMRSVAGVTADSLVEHKKAWSAVMNDDPAIIDEVINSSCIMATSAFLLFSAPIASSSSSLF